MHDHPSPKHPEPSASGHTNDQRPVPTHCDDELIDGLHKQAYLTNEFHPVVSFQVVRDDQVGGAGNTSTNPAGQSCQHGCLRDPLFPLAVPPARMCADARSVVANPEQYHDRPLLRRMAWMALMAERGLSVDQNRLAQMPVEMGV